MLIRFHKCDLCGSPCNIYELRYTIKMKRYFNGALGAEIGPERMDICEACQKKIVEFILKRGKANDKKRNSPCSENLN